MNREILFRGKLEYNGKWIYGDLLQYENGDVAIFGEKLSSFGYECTEMSKRDRVIPDTIGQYTGLKDKNGNKIFEGDILRLGDEFHYFIFNIEYGSFVAASIKGDIGIRLFQRTIKNCGYAIIGNIYDNPELMK